MKSNLKNMVFALVVAAASAAPAADVLSFWPATDPADRYADGTEVVGETMYALVWVKTGVPFQGFLVDGSLVNKNEDENHLFVVETTNPGMGIEFNLSTYKGYSDYLQKDGSWCVFLLDTRILQADAQGEVKFVERSGSIPYPSSTSFTGVNAWGLVGEADEVGMTPDTFLTPDSATSDRVASLPPDAPQPQITNIQIVDVDGEERVRLTVAKTLKCVWYDAARGPIETPDAEKKVSVLPKSGVGEGTITLDVPKRAADDKMFYRVIRNTVK